MLRRLASAGALLAGLMATAGPASRPVHVVLIVGQGPTRTGDRMLSERLEGRGLLVSLVEDREFRDSAVRPDTRPLVIVSSSARAEILSERLSAVRWRGVTFRGSLNEPGTVTVGGTPAGVSGGNQFSGSASVPSGTSQVVVTATDPSGNLRTNTYQVTQAGSSKSFTYDANGNLTGDGVKTYEWDSENRLLAVKLGGSPLASFTYDGSGRRATKTAGGVTTTYIYHGAQFLEEQSGGSATKRYVYGPGIDRPLAQIVGGVTSYFIADHLGSVVRLTDAAGAATLGREYDPWGRLLLGSTTGGYGFTGREWDSESSLYYYRARFYATDTGRFLTEDAIRDHGSLYRYVHNNPIKYVDPTGAVPGQRFKDRDTAVLDTYQSMAGIDIIGGFTSNFEWGGKVCQDLSNMCFFCTAWVTNWDDGTVSVNKSPCPSGSKEKGYYHSHSSGLGWTPGIYAADHKIVDELGGDYAAYVWLVGRRSLFGIDGRVFRYQKGYPYEGRHIGTVMPEF
jgi:RHS repeat-associated protein